MERNWPSNRVVDAWNALSNYIVGGDSIGTLKALTDLWMKMICGST